MLTQQVAVWMRIPTAKIPCVYALWIILVLMEHAKQVSLPDHR